MHHDNSWATNLIECNLLYPQSGIMQDVQYAKKSQLLDCVMSVCNVQVSFVKLVHHLAQCFCIDSIVAMHIELSSDWPN